MDLMLSRDITYYGLTDTFNDLFYCEGKYSNLTKLVLNNKNIKLALKLVSKTSGKDTKGSDGLSFKDVMNMETKKLNKLISHRILYEPTSRTRTLNIIKNNKSMEIEIGSVLDRIAQQCILNILTPIAEGKFSYNNYGYRLNTTTKHAFAKFINPLWKSNNDWTIMNINIESFFKSIDKELVIDKLRKDFNIEDAHFLKLVKKFIYTKKEGESTVNRVGLPKGNVLSPILSNIYLSSLDWTMDNIIETNSKFDKYIRRFISNGVVSEKLDLPYLRYVRYVDEIRIITPSESMVGDIIDLIDSELTKIGLEMNYEKSIYYDWNSSLQANFLGFKVNKKPNGIVISPNDPKKYKKMIRDSYNYSLKTKNYSSFKSTLTRILTQLDITTNVNWIFSYTESLIHKKFKTKRNLDYVMTLIDGKRHYTINGDSFPLRELRTHTTTSISNYIKVPFIEGFKVDSKWVNVEDYINIDNRYSSRLIMYLPGLLHRQKFKCYVTKEYLTPQYLDIHHKVPLYRGGDDSFSNLVVISRDIHQQLHGLRKLEPNIASLKNYKVLSNKL